MRRDPRGRKPKPEGTRKRPVTAHLDPDLHAALHAMVVEEEVTLSEAINALLRRAVMHRDTGRWWDLFGPSVEARIRAEVGGMSNRLAHLLARTALESAADREMLRRKIAAELVTSGYSADEAQQMAQREKDRAWNYAVNDLKKPSAGVRELLGLGGGDGE